MFWLRLSVEETGQQMANVDDKVQGMYDTNKGVHDKVMDVEDVGGAAQDIEAKVIDGAQVLVPNQLSASWLSFMLDVEKISRPIPNDSGDLTRSWFIISW